MMDTILAVAIVLLTSVSVIAYITYAKKQNWLQQQRLITYLLQLKTLIAFSQKHRGMSAAYIQGDHGALDILTSIDHTLEPIIQKLNDEPCIAQQERWIGYMDHWQRLKQQYKQLDLASSFSQHTSLITNLLYLFEDISEQRAFNKNLYQSTSNSSVLWQDLPFTAEYVGQSRAVGVAIVARGVCTQVDKVKLGYLVTKILELSNSVFNFLERNGSEQTQLINQARNKCHIFTQLIEKEVLAADKISISSQAYFASASQAMDAINRLLDAELNALQEKIKHTY